MPQTLSKYLWLTDTHLWPWDRWEFVASIASQKARGVLLTGDIANSASMLISNLRFLGKNISRPVWFVIGNHDLHLSSIEETHKAIRALCEEFPNLTWMDDVSHVPLTDDTCCIGHGGWCDARVGDPNLLLYTLDWWMIKEFRDLPTMHERIEAYRAIADCSAEVITSRLERAFKRYETIYLLTHYPPWVEAQRDCHPWLERFWLPYNTNLVLGKTLERLMEKRPDKRLVVLCGHTHVPTAISVANNLECRVGRDGNVGEVIYL